MKFKRKSVIFLGLSLALLSYSNVSALTQEELNDYVLSAYAERYVSSDRLEGYLKKNGVDMKVYKKYLKDLNMYNSSIEYLWDKVENGNMLIDEILFSDKTVRDEYEKALKKFGSEELAYNFIKKNMINDPKRFINKLEGDMKDLNKIRAAFKDKINRELSDVEIMFLSDMDTVRHAMYAGYNGGNLLPPEDWLGMDAIVDIIDKGRGYEYFGVTDGEIQKYLEFRTKREKYDKLIISYTKIYSMFESINSQIMNTYGKNIFKELTDDERKDIYEKSIKGFVFDEDEAKKKVLKKLLSKNVLSEGDLKDEDKEGIVIKDNSNINPWAELNKYLKDNSKNQGSNSLASLYNGKGFEVIFDDLDDKFIYIKYQDKDINTYLRVNNEGVINGAMVGELLDILENELSLKTVFSKKEMLTYFENKINTFDISIQEVSNIKFNEISEIFKSIGVSLYLKNIDFEEDIDDGDEKDIDDDIDIVYKIKFNLKDKMAVFNLGESNEIKIEDISEILDLFEIKSVISKESILLYKNGEIKVSKACGYSQDEVSLNQLKMLFKDIDENVVINIVKEEAY